MTKALNNFFLWVYVLLFVASAGFAVNVIFVKGTFFDDFVELFCGFFFMLALFASAYLHYGLRSVSDNTKHRVYLFMTSVCFIWLLGLVFLGYLGGSDQGLFIMMQLFFLIPLWFLSVTVGSSLLARSKKDAALASPSLH
ncbi:MAG: hypothetical protein AAB391_04075 [Patescibacteria group bacterium]